MIIVRKIGAFGFLWVFGRLLHVSALGGQVIGWGDNLAGQATGVPTGNPPGMANNSTGVVSIAGQALSNVVSISAGRGHSLALTSSGQIFGWGNNASGEATGFKTEFPYRASGQVRIGGEDLQNAVRISAGCHFSLALRADGVIAAWGERPEEGGWGKLKPPPGLTNVIDVKAGLRRSLALKRDGTVLEWDLDGSLIPPPPLSNIVAISAGRADHGRNLALTDMGLVIAWGGETIHGDMTPPPDLSNVVAIAAGYNHSLALKSDGTVVGWGFNSAGQATGVPTSSDPRIGHGLVSVSGRALTNVVAIAAADEYSLALRRDGTVVAWGRLAGYAGDVPSGLSNVVAIAAGDGFCLAITTNIASHALER